MCEASHASVRFFSLHLFFLCSPFGFLSHYTPGLGWRDHPGWTGIARTALPSEPWAGPEQQGRSPRDVTGLLSHRGLGVTNNLPPSTGICRCLAAPGGLFPTQDLPAQGGLCPRGLGDPRLRLSLAGVLPAPEWGDGKTRAGLWAGAPTTSPGTPQARAAAPRCGRVPHGAACPPGPSPPAPHFTPGLVQ